MSFPSLGYAPHLFRGAVEFLTCWAAAEAGQAVGEAGKDAAGPPHIPPSCTELVPWRPGCKVCVFICTAHAKKVAVSVTSTMDSPCTLAACMGPATACIHKSVACTFLHSPGSSACTQQRSMGGNLRSMCGKHMALQSSKEGRRGQAGLSSCVHGEAGSMPHRPKVRGTCKQLTTLLSGAGAAQRLPDPSASLQSISGCLETHGQARLGR